MSQNYFISDQQIVPNYSFIFYNECHNLNFSLFNFFQNPKPLIMSALGKTNTRFFKWSKTYEPHYMHYC